MIIAHNKNCAVFADLLNKTVLQLQTDANKNTKHYLKRGGLLLEKDVFKCINDKAQGTIFDGNIELISGQKFPDIVAYVNQNKAYGLEVKTTQTNKWKSTGSSIFEGTRVENVENIYLLFGKLSNPIEFKYRKYEECLYSVAITHSPRYLIDMNIEKRESIFSKIGIDYDTLRKSDNPFEPIKNFLRQGLKDGEDLWWADNENENIGLNIRLWSNLSPAEKKQLRVLSLSYFPILFGDNQKKYTQLATWMVARFGVVNHALRDTFTAGGTIKIAGIEFPKIFEHIENDLDDIIQNVDKIKKDDIYYYWKIAAFTGNNAKEWKKQCLKNCTYLDKNQFDIIKKLLK